MKPDKRLLATGITSNAMRGLRLLTIVLSALIAGIGVVVMVAPLTLVEFGRLLQTPGSLYAIAAVRVAFGALLLLTASTSRMPRTLRVIGTVIIVAGLLTPLIGVERAHAMLEWWAGNGIMFMRVWAVFPVALGILIIYAITGPRRNGP